MGEAYRIAKEEMESEMARLRGLRNRLWDGVKDMEEVYLNGDLEQARRTFSTSALTTLKASR
ncbi:cysteine desulfurase [Klebsiella michiganensis]|uniref:Cysteine desulfurase n=1 Tax=Klebsiella michiganensis TaxID=1134687 RepID=A0A7H4PNB4_9ENTR|nr:cysteine desulfurase [Klebsiella michiganensis]